MSEPPAETEVEPSPPRRARVALRLSYLGSGFEGWQAQAAEREARTVQGVLEHALARLYRLPVSVHGAGRTDAGVHADGQVAHLDVPGPAPLIPLPGLQRGLNTLLPPDVRVEAAWDAEPGWHARISARGKVYVYRLRQGEWLHPHRGLVEALCRERLDVDGMREAARRLVGRRDFAPFSVTGSEPRGTIRTLARLGVDVLDDEDGLLLTVTAVGDGFLRGMVRRLVGTLREVGRGRTRPEDVLSRPGPTAEARGLTLRRVLYAPESLPA